MRSAEETKTVCNDYPDSPTSDGVIRLLIELRCEKLRPQLLSLAKRLEDKAPSAPGRRCSRCVFKRPSGTGRFDAAIATAEITNERTFEKAPLNSLFARR